MRILRFVVAGLLLLSGARPCAAAGAAGEDAFDVLRLDVSPRAVGLGGAYTALAAEPAALHYNPAGLALVRWNEAAFMHNQYVEGLTQDYVAYASPRGWGASLHYLSFGGVQRTTISNPDGAGLGETGLSNLALTGGYARDVHRDWSVGAAGKYISESIAGVTASGFALDFGALYAAPWMQGLSFGAAARNLGPAVKFQGQREPLPFNVRGGAAYAFAPRGVETRVALDLEKQRSGDPIVAFGAETLLRESFALRFGVDTGRDAGPGVSFGLGWRVRNWNVDYAFVPLGELGAVHRLGVSLRWGYAGAAPAPARPAAAAPPVKAPPPVGMTVPPGAEAPPAESGDQRQVMMYDQLGATALSEGYISDALAYYDLAVKLAARQQVQGEPLAAAHLGMALALLRQSDAAGGKTHLEAALAAGPSVEQKARIEAELGALKPGAAPKNQP